MNLIDFSKRIENIYAIIDNRQNEKKIEYIKAGFEASRISFEDIYLEDIFENELVPVLSPILDYFKYAEVRQIRNKIYKIYIAALCEIAKRGFNQGGILKTMDAYIGFQFDRNRHYELIKQALKYEKIPILSNRNSHYYEETIIFEAGIPRKFHYHVLSLFLLYWKWMKGIEKQERMQFLKDFINEEYVDSYILVPSDFERMKSYRGATSDFKEKTLKVCYKLEEIFSAIDEYPELINATNIDNVCCKVSENLRFNIETVIRTTHIRKVFLNYSQRISFSKLQKIIGNLSVDVNIIIPSGQTLTKESYSSSNFYGGQHTINEIVYEVSYAIGLSLKEIFDLTRQSIHRQNQSYIYVSDEYFEVEIDGIPQSVKTFIFNNECGYVYVGKVPSASVAYIDNICVESDKSYKINASLRKIWNRELKQNCLAVYIKEARCSSVEYAMKTVSVFNGFNSIIRQANRNGFSIIRDKWLGVPDFSNLNDIYIAYSVGDVLLEEITINLEPIMVFSFQSGIQIGKIYDVNQFYWDNRLIIYTMHPIEKSQEKLEYKGHYQGFHVYFSVMDLAKDTYDIGDLSIVIKNQNQSYMSFASQYDFKDDKICFDEDSDISIRTHNIEKADIYYLKLSHDWQTKTIRLNTIANLECVDIKGFMEDFSYKDGKWTLALYKEQENICEFKYIVLPKLSVRMAKQIYCEGENVNVEIFARANCFYEDDIFSSSVYVDAGIAQIELKGNLVTSKELIYEVYNSRSECFQEVNIRPAVWGIRILDHEKNKWYSTKDTFLTHKSLDNYRLLICSTRQHYINIKCDNMITKREIFAGYNRLAVKEIFKDWKEVNHMYFYDESNMQQMITVLFEPSMQYKNTAYENNNMISTLNYEGAINTDIALRVYANDILVEKISRNAQKNRFLIHIMIPDIKYYNCKELTFEVSFDQRDPVTFHRFVIELKDTSDEFILSEYCNLYKLMKEYISLGDKGESTSMKNLNVIELIGGC